MRWRLRSICLYPVELRRDKEQNAKHMSPPVIVSSLLLLRRDPSKSFRHTQQEEGKGRGKTRAWMGVGERRAHVQERRKRNVCVRVLVFVSH